MEQQTNMLDLMLPPAFFVKENRITQLNEAAARLFLRKGLLLDPILKSGAEDYAAFSGGMLYVTLSIQGQNWGASVTRMDAQDIFVLDQQFDSPQLRILALAAAELRGPLSDAMLAAQSLGSQSDTSHLNRGLYQLLRIIGNMSDADGCTMPFHPEVQDVNALFQEITEKISTMSEQHEITYHGTQSPVLCAVDRQQLERAALNMISNALKFTQSGSRIQVHLHPQGNQLRFCVTDSGSGIAESVRASLFQRYLREPGIEDSRHGIGLGMLLIRNAAASHGGAVLVDQPKTGGTRVTFTISTDLEIDTSLHSLQIDYAGELDHVLLELSETLPSNLY